MASKNGKQHGNSIHGIYPATFALRKGERFDGYMREMYRDALQRRGLSDADLDAAGVRGDIIRHTARLGVVADLVWQGMAMAGSVGDVASFYAILKEHGHRFEQAIRALHRELELAHDPGEDAIIDALKVAKEMTEDG